MFMEEVRGVRLKDVIRHHSQETIDAVRPVLIRALLSLWLAGYFHMDLHGSNVMVDLSGAQPRVKIIDFGLAAQMPEHARDKVRDYVSRLGESAAVEHFWKKYGEPLADTVVLARQRDLGAPSEYWPNVTALSLLPTRR